MKALSKLHKEVGIWMTDVPAPELGHNDLLIKIRKTAICGTDIHIYNWDEWSQKTIPVPMVVGHEYVGEVVAIGQEVRGFAIGDADHAFSIQSMSKPFVFALVCQALG